jgi:2-polyprenyl-6-hydroxyphenyl methylase/3-demethylubiquinone-9 3-methyltransferase
MEAADSRLRRVETLPAATRQSRRPLLRRLIDGQISLARRFDRLVPPEFRLDGNREFADRLVPSRLCRGALVYDVGGGKRPNIGEERKRRLALSVVGLDIDAAQLAAAPPGAYDRTVCADITRYRGKGEADRVICQALLEHVRDTGSALSAIASILKPGGVALLYIPSRHAAYAALNRLLPEAGKRWLLHTIYPRSQRVQGFPAYYDRCTPAEIIGLAGQCGLVLESARFYYYSDYFSFCFPLHALWRVWQLLYRSIAGNQASEAFSLVLRKTPGDPQ